MVLAECSQLVGHLLHGLRKQTLVFLKLNQNSELVCKATGKLLHGFAEIPARCMLSIRRLRQTQHLFLRILCNWLVKCRDSGQNAAIDCSKSANFQNVTVCKVSAGHLDPADEQRRPRTQQRNLTPSRPLESWNAARELRIPQAAGHRTGHCQSERAPALEPGKGFFGHCPQAADRQPCPEEE